MIFSSIFDSLHKPRQFSFTVIQLIVFLLHQRPFSFYFICQPASCCYYSYCCYSFISVSVFRPSSPLHLAFVCLRSSSPSSCRAIEAGPRFEHNFCCCCCCFVQCSPLAADERPNKPNRATSGRVDTGYWNPRRASTTTTANSVFRTLCSQSDNGSPASTAE